MLNIIEDLFRGFCLSMSHFRFSLKKFRYLKPQDLCAVLSKSPECLQHEDCFYSVFLRNFLFLASRCQRQTDVSPIPLDRHKLFKDLDVNLAGKFYL